MSASDKPVDPICNCAAIRRAARHVTRLYDQALAPHDLRITQYPVLAWLAEEGSMPMNLLATRLGVDRATMGHNLRPLEARGFVTLSPGEDRRNRIVTLTEAGRAKLREAWPAWKTAQRLFENAFGRADAAAMRTTMTEIASLEFGVTEAA